MSDSKPAASASKLGALRATLIAEGLVSLALAILGLVLIWTQNDRPPWSGFGLIGLGLLVYLLRGQVITKLSVGKDGIAWEMAKAALDKAEEAARAAEFAGEVIDQQLGAGGKTGAAPAGRSETVALGQAEKKSKKDLWAHPRLETMRKGKPVDEEDPQSGRWGGEDERNGRRLDAEYEPAERGWVKVTMRVTSTDPQGKPLTRPVRFHLHDTFHPPVETVKPKDGVAETSRLAWGAFTVGAEVAGEPDSFLELNLATDPEAPEGWRDR